MKNNPRNPAVLLAAASKVAAICMPSGIDVMLVGGLAAQHYGSPLLTGDLDLALDKMPMIAGKVLSFGGIRTVIDGVPTDLIVRTDKWRRLYDAAQNSSRKVSTLPVPIVPVGFLIAMKMVAGRDKDHLSIEHLLGHDTRKSHKYHEEARVVVAKYLGEFALDELDRLVEEARWKDSRGML